MAKKSRRSREKPQLSPAQLVRPRKEAGALTPPAKSNRQLTELEREYRYVLTDLKRIALIAAAMMAVMVVLALLLV